MSDNAGTKKRHAKKVANLHYLEFGGDLGMGGGPGWPAEGEDGLTRATDPNLGTGIFHDNWPGTYGISYDSKPETDAPYNNTDSESQAAFSEYELEIADLYQPPGTQKP